MDFPIRQVGLLLGDAGPSRYLVPSLMQFRFRSELQTGTADYIVPGEVKHILG